MQPVSPGTHRGILAEYLAEMRARGLSARTQDEYGRLVGRYLGEPPTLTPDALHAFVFGAGPSRRPPSPATAAVRRAAMVSFFAFLVRRGHLARNVAADLPAVRTRASLPRGLSTEDIRRLVAVIPDTTPGRRDRALILTALFTGLRRSELVGLTVNDIDFSHRPPTMRVRVKGGAVRLRELPTPVIAAILAARCARSAEQDATSTRPLFGVSGSGFAANLRRYGRMAGIGHVTPHALRHTAAKLRRDAGASLEDVSAFLGHASITTTAVYLRRLEGWRDDGWREVSRLLALPHSQLLLDVEARAGPTHEWPSERGNAHSARWQGGPEHGTPLPTSYSSSRSSDELLPTRAGATMTVPWRDDRISLLKSALQKYIRRGETDKAVAVAGRLLELPGGRSALARRLPIIAAEDVGITYIAAAATDHGEWSDEDLVSVAAGLSRVPKSKEAYWLAATVWSDPQSVDEVTPNALQRHLVHGEYLSALRCAMAAKQRRTWRSGDRLIAALREAGGRAPAHAAAIVDASLRREAKGGSGTDELLAAAIIATIDRPADPPDPFDPVPPTGDRQLNLDFYVADGHTAVGQRALRGVAMRHGLTVRFMTDLMFSYESLVLGPSEIPGRWKAQAQAQEARASGWRSVEEGRQLWESLRSDVAIAVREELQSVAW